MFLLTPIVLVIVIFLAQQFYKVISNFHGIEKFLKNVPHPPSVLLFGNTIDFLGPSKDILSKLVEHNEKYGEIVKFYKGPFSITLLVADPKFMELILNSNKLINKANQYDYMLNWLGTGLLTSTGAKWKSRRRVVTPTFHFSILEQFVNIFESVGNVLITKLRKEVGMDSVDIYPLITLCTLDIICEAAMGTSVNAQENEDCEYVRSVKTMCKLVMDRSFSPLPNIVYPFTPRYFVERKALKVLHSYTDSVIDKKINEIKSNVNSEKNEDEFGIKKRMAFLDVLLQCTINGKPLTREDLREEVDTFMFEGHDTTSSAIAFALYSLATNPEVQKKVIEEQQQIFGKSLKDATATMKDLQDMKYLELVLKETLRLYPSVPLFGRLFSEDTTYDGTTYPKGINVMIFPFRSHRNPKYFKNPEKFIPERFDSREDQEIFSYVPFSAGPRNCVGQKFAMLEMKSTISKVLRNFELLPSTPWHTLELVPATILLSQNGVKISLKERA